MNRLAWARGLATAAIVAAAAVLPSAPTPAQSEPPPVSIGILLPPSTSVIRTCDGEDVFSSGQGGFIVNRSEPGAALTIGVELGGSAVEALAEVPTSVEMLAGETSASVLLEFASHPAAGTLTLTVLPGEGYSVGAPATVEQPVGAPAVQWDCADPLAVEPDLLDQTIPVGGVPEPYGLYVDGSSGGGSSPPSLGEDAPAALPRDLWSPMTTYFETPTVGELPPGLSYVDDAWEGAATTPGTFTFEVRLCAEPGVFSPDVAVCTGSAEATVVVEAGGGDEPVPEAAPAAPVAGEAAFTG